MLDRNNTSHLKAIQCNIVSILIPVVLAVCLYTPTTIANDDLEKNKEEPSTISGIIGFVSTTGGDDIGRLIFEGEDQGDLEAGSGFQLYGGVIYRPINYFEARATVGYQVDRTVTAEGSAYFNRTVLEFIPTYAYKGHRFGFGVAYHINPTIEGHADVNFRNSLGLILSYGYKVTPFLYFGVRLTRMDYEIDSEGILHEGKNTINADSFGLDLNFEF